MKKRRIICDHRTALGDTIVLTAAFKALHETHPGTFETDYIGHHGRYSDGNNVFANSPYMTDIFDGDIKRDPKPQIMDGVQYVNACYGYGVNNCGRPYHFLHAFVEDLEKKLGVQIRLRDFHGDVYLSEEEKQPWPGLPATYAVIDAGIKRDFTNKLWSHHRYQQVVNATKDRIQWVQIGGAADEHPKLENVISLVGQTNVRQLMQVIYRSSLVLTPISAPMHLAAAVPTIADGPRPLPVPIDELHQRRWQEMEARNKRGPMPLGLPVFSRKVRPCIVLAGQREPRHWEAYPGHVWLGDTGKLKGCPVETGASCWRNKTVKIDGDESLCFNPLKDEAGQPIPECLHRVTIEDVVRAVESFV